MNFSIGQAKRQLAALKCGQAWIEFDANGIILQASPEFLSTMGYASGEARGQHHRMFVDAAYARSPDYTAFWERLRKGEPQSAEFARLQYKHSFLRSVTRPLPCMTPDAVMCLL